MLLTSSRISLSRNSCPCGPRMKNGPPSQWITAESLKMAGESVAVGALLSVAGARTPARQWGRLDRHRLRTVDLRPFVVSRGSGVEPNSERIGSLGNDSTRHPGGLASRAESSKCASSGKGTRSQDCPCRACYQIIGRMFRDSALNLPPMSWDESSSPRQGRYEHWPTNCRRYRNPSSRRLKLECPGSRTTILQTMQRPPLPEQVTMT